MTEEDFRRQNNFRDYRARHCCNCKYFKWATAEAVEEERSRRRAHREPMPIDFCTK